MPVDVLDVTQRFMRDPIRILVKQEELTLDGIKQFYVNVEKEVRFLSTNYMYHFVNALQNIFRYISSRCPFV